ncbi:hypothetical protein SLEP1_g35588 [Rubroshorea leprosula]|uniref:Uncharacterized protein n=1 Tax=Rubroshorea leprosula TaxID=152421 RepID=A0AAV5KNR2_9ROSI|nr:hypothetical protein SLEP1_g35588 [Rubroshorea leprosula]
MSSKRNLKELVNRQKDPSTPRSATRRNVHQRFRRNDGVVVNEADEAFLHDHKKCIEEQAMQNRFNLDWVLPGYGSACTAGCPQSKEEKTYSDSFNLPEPEDLSMPEFSTQRKSPPCSPIPLYRPSIPVACNSEDVEFVLKQENDLD